MQSDCAVLKVKETSDGTKTISAGSHRCIDALAGFWVNRGMKDEQILTDFSSVTTQMYL